jgi:hypothetical protein
MQSLLRGLGRVFKVYWHRYQMPNGICFEKGLCILAKYLGFP